MLDERWSQDVEEVAQALRVLLQTESSIVRVRAAEASEDGRDRVLEAALAAFGLEDLEAGPEMFARLAYELGHALASGAHVECMPVQALLGQRGVALAFGGLADASAPAIAAVHDGGVDIVMPEGAPLRSVAGDWRVAHAAAGERVGDSPVANRLQRFSDLVTAARLTGAGQALLKYAASYAREREQFGRPIGAFQSVAHKLADVAIALDGAELTVRKAAFMASPEAGGDGAPPCAFAIMARARASQSALLAATHAHQVMGGAGFAREYDVQLYSRRIRSWALRGPRTGPDLQALARMVLDPDLRGQLHLLWHNDTGLSVPRWALEADE